MAKSLRGYKVKVDVTIGSDTHVEVARLPWQADGLMCLQVGPYGDGIQFFADKPGLLRLADTISAFFAREDVNAARETGVAAEPSSYDVPPQAERVA